MACKQQDWEGLVAGYELGLITPEERRRVEEHVLECDDCFEDLYGMAPVAEAFRERKRAAGSAGALAPEETPVEAQAAPALRSPRWAWALGGAAAAVVVIGILALTFQGPPAGPVKRGGPEGPTLLLYAPRGEVEAPGALEWSKAPDAVSYEVRLYTEEGELLWEERATTATLALPEAVKGRLEPGSAFFWEVEATSAKGTRWKSEVARFTVRK